MKKNRQLARVCQQDRFLSALQRSDFKLGASTYFCCYQNLVSRTAVVVSSARSGGSSEGRFPCRNNNGWNDGHGSVANEAV
jgi:hypothetical protein